MYSNLCEVDTEYRDVAIDYAEAEAVVARGEAARARVLARAAAIGNRRVAELGSSSSREAELPFRALAAELGAAANVSDRTVQRRMNDAAVLEEAFPATFEAWDAGRVSWGHVAAIMEHGTPLTDPGARAVFEREALVRAEDMTPGRLGASLARLAESLQPRPIVERHQEARASRVRVWGTLGTGWRSSSRRNRRRWRTRCMTESRSKRRRSRTPTPQTLARSTRDGVPIRSRSRRRTGPRASTTVRPCRRCDPTSRPRSA